ncbi:hypothetical protein QVD17_16522 [Tagetes erecta]|uniref:Uncharacterized protein n=1 Tax=Tagetes erecta TaxID=13708 RepID=A0AAD8KV86_TARER|nr:hypothetical protein QVD17_16522 [Tagetes erecta]
MCESKKDIIKNLGAKVGIFCLCCFSGLCRLEDEMDEMEWMVYCKEMKNLNMIKLQQGDETISVSVGNLLEFADLDVCEKNLLGDILTRKEPKPSHGSTIALVKVSTDIHL